MVQKLEASTSQLYPGVFGSALKEWLFIFLTVLVPLDFIYRLGQLLNDFPPFQLAWCFSSTVIFFTIFAVIISLFSWVAARVCSTISLNGADRVIKVNTILGILFVAIIFSDYLWPWMQIIFSNTNILVFLKKIRYLLIILFFTVFVTTIIILKKKQYNLFFQHVMDIFERFFKINVIIVALSVVFLLFSTVVSYFAVQRENGSVALADKGKLKSYPNIILITFDALSAQHMSLYRYHFKTTPNLDKLGQESYVFDNMYASCNWTLPSLSSLLSGKHPSHHKLINSLSYYYFGNNRDQNLPVVLKAMGYETAVAWSNGFGCPWRSNLAGIDKISPNLSLYRVIYILGFGANPWLYDIITMNHIYKFVFEYPQKFMKKPAEIETIFRPDTTFSHASELLNGMQKPLFIWMHIYQPHSPYLPGDFLYSILKEKVFDTEEKLLRNSFVNPYPIASQPMIDKLAMRYDETISYADHELGKFLSFLKEKGLFENSILIFSSDHGEMFERGYLSHGGPYLYQSLVHVPLIIHLPGQVQGQRIGANVSDVDIAPTILDLLGGTTPKWMDGRSFLPALKDNNFDTGTKFSMNLSYINLNTNVNLKTKVIAAIRGNYKLINYLDWNRYELFDLKNDAQEKTDLITTQPVIFSSLKAEIDQLLGR